MANIISTYVIYLKVVDPSLPFWILEIVGIFGGSLMLFLPETMGKDLPQTLSNGELDGEVNLVPIKYFGMFPVFQ